MAMSGKRPTNDFAPTWLKVADASVPQTGTKPSKVPSDARAGTVKNQPKSVYNYNNTFGQGFNDFTPKFMQQPKSAERQSEEQPSAPSSEHNYTVDNDYNYGSYPYYDCYAYDKYAQPSYHKANDKPSPTGRQDKSKYVHPHARYFEDQGGYYDFPYDFYAVTEAFFPNYKKPNGSVDEEFPQLGGDESGKTTLKSEETVWDKQNGKVHAVLRNKSNPSTSTNNNVPIEPVKEVKQNSSIYKALVPNKPQSAKVNSVGASNGPLKPINTSIQLSPVNGTGISKGIEVTTRQSPTSSPPIDILSTRFVTQPRNLGNKKSDFLKTLKRGDETMDDEDFDSLKFNQVAKPHANSHNGDGSMCNKMDTLTIDNSVNISLSSSLEAEQRLLKEMGWNEQEDEDYEITEDDLKQFQSLAKQVKPSPNGLRSNMKTWAAAKPPQLMEFYKNNPQDWVESAPSSDSEEDN